MIDTIKNILAQTQWHASRRILEIHRALDIPQNKRGRKQKTDPTKRAAYIAEFCKARRKRLKQEGKCITCGGRNDRLPRVHCTRCANKNSATRRKQIIETRLESN